MPSEPVSVWATAVSKHLGAGSVWTHGFILWDKCPGGQLLSRTVVVRFSFQETTRLLSRVSAPFHLTAPASERAGLSAASQPLART